MGVVAVVVGVVAIDAVAIGAVIVVVGGFAVACVVVIVVVVVSWPCCVEGCLQAAVVAAVVVVAAGSSLLSNTVVAGHPKVHELAHGSPHVSIVRRTDPPSYNVVHGGISSHEHHLHAEDRPQLVMYGSG